MGSTSLAAVVGLAALLAGVVLGFVLPGERSLAWILVGVGGGLVAIASLVNYRKIGTAVATRKGRFGIGASVGSLMFVGIIVLVNAIASAVPLRFDLTSLSQFTLTAQSRQVLRDLESPVEIVSFFTPGPTAPVGSYAEGLVEEYRRFTDQITFRQVDPTLNPELARDFGVDQLGAAIGVLVFSGDAGRKRVFGNEVMAEAENAFTGALLEVSGRQQKNVYVISGHGEHAIAGSFADARSGLRDSLFRVAELDLLSKQSIPDDAAALIIAGPRQAFSTPEVELLLGYQAGGGRLLLLLDPNADTGLEGLLQEFGLTIPKGNLVDPDFHLVAAAETLLVPRTRNAFSLPEVYFPGVAAVVPNADLSPDTGIKPLVWSSPGSWLETGVAGTVPALDGADLPGPLAIGVMFTSSQPDGGSGRLVAIADSDFATNGHFNSGNNGDFFVSIVNWLTEGTSVVRIDRKPLSMRRLVLTPEQARLLHTLAIGLLPLLLFVFGALMWWRRR